VEVGAWFGAPGCLDPLALTVPEAAVVAGVSTRTMYRAVEAGSVPTVRLTPQGRVFIPRLALERFLAEGG
jgi:excisionase family DNA binding protein